MAKPEEKQLLQKCFSCQTLLTIFEILYIYIYGDSTSQSSNMSIILGYLVS